MIVGEQDPYFHQTGPAETPVIHAGEEAGLPFLVEWRGVDSLLDFFRCSSATNQERHATQVKTRHFSTFAPCVSRLFVRYACKLIVCFLRSKPPTVQRPYVLWQTNVPRLSPRERVEP